MITVIVKINGRTIFTRSAKNCGPPSKNLGKQMRVYQTDAGQEILHNRKKGAVRLAIKLLRTLKAADDEWHRKNFKA